MISSITSATGTTSSTAATSAQSEAGSQDRFLKLLVTQMQNQDPLNPLDNAQVTSQMAQIQTVAGIEKLNTSLGTMASSFQQAQALQAAALIGRDVLVPGNTMYISEGQGRGAFELASGADPVTVEVTDGTGRVIDRISLGALAKGRHHFDWSPEGGTSLGEVSFKVAAGSGDASAAATAYTRDTVGAVISTANGLELDLFSGQSVAYNTVAAVMQN